VTALDPSADPFGANEAAWAQAADWGGEPRMNELETLMWRSERHPQRSSTICALMALDCAPEWQRLHSAHDWATRLVPRMRDRVLEPAAPVGPPAWMPDPTFDLDYHLRRVRLPAPGGMPQLLTFAQSAAMAPFDRNRPLWEATLVEGLPDGKAAYFLKLHHSLTDGLGTIQLLSMVQSRTREHTPNKPVSAPLRPAPGLDAVGLALAELGEWARDVPAAAGALAAAGGRALARPGAAAGSALRFTQSMRRVLSPPPVTGSPLFRGRTATSWRFGVLDCPLAEMKAAARAAGGSVNDAYFAVLTGGLRRYHQMHGIDVDELPMAMPVSLRKADDPMGGNKFSGALFAGPVGITDPAERIATIRGIVLMLRAEPALNSIATLAPVVNRLPSAVGAAATRFAAAADLSGSNVPGIPQQTYIAGAKVERVYPFGPLPGVAVMAGMVSHAGHCCIGLNMDGSVIPDPDVLVGCMRDGTAEVLALA
jgi:diacylglycerol O-acyltransferase / wax synthase